MNSYFNKLTDGLFSSMMTVFLVVLVGCTGGGETTVIGGGTDTTPPTVTLTAPAAGNVSGTVTVSANASDNVGVVGVQFRLNGVNLGSEDTTAPYSVSWNTVSATAGTHTLTAIARDAAGLTTTSAGVSVTIANTPPAPSALCDSVGYSTEKFNLTAPYCLDMRDNDYLSYPIGNPVAIANGDASATDEPTGSYNGGHAAKIVPPTTELYAGLGNFNFAPSAVGNRMNIRYLVYWGYDAVQAGVKLNIMNDGVSTRPMVISRELRTGQNTTFPHDYMIPIPSQNVNEAPTINDPGYPDNPSFFIAGASAPLAEGNYAHQWVSWEFEIITDGSAPILNFYVHTRDGIITYGQGNPYATHAWTDGPIDLIRASVGWYWGPGWIQSPEAYVKISDVVISNTYIGPPADFIQ
jgi:Bacterial Ig domain